MKDELLKKEVSAPVREAQPVFSLAPRSIEEAIKYAELIAKSSLVPEAFRGKAADILIAVQMGMEVGLSPTQALQGMAVINGKPSLWGDTFLAVCMASPSYEWHKENQDPAAAWAECSVKRKGSEVHTVRFTMEMAKTAGLKEKAIWKNYPTRMLQMRARAWAFRDKFADALKGMNMAEEMQDIHTRAIDTTAMMPRAVEVKEEFSPPLATNAEDAKPTAVPVTAGSPNGQGQAKTETLVKEKTPTNVMLGEFLVKDVHPVELGRWLVITKEGKNFTITDQESLAVVEKAKKSYEIVEVYSIYGKSDVKVESRKIA